LNPDLKKCKIKLNWDSKNLTLNRHTFNAYLGDGMGYSLLGHKW